MFKYHIQTVQVGAGGSSTISFSNIPQIYDDLVLVTSLRDNVGSGGWENAFIYPNNSSANMVSRAAYGWGSNNTGSLVNNPAVIYHQTARGNNTANTFSNSSVTISNYSKSTFKSISAETSVERNDVAGINAFTSALWSDSSAINSLTIAAASGLFVQYSSASLYGIKRGTNGVTKAIAPATGGTITTSGGYTYHTFTSSGTFSTPLNIASADALVVAGGGGGGDGSARAGGGGGAGGYLTYSGALSGGSYSVTVGAGGSINTSGTNSSAFGLTPIGGGKGGLVGVDGASGGSGGGAGEFFNGGGGAGTSGQGFAGGAASSSAYNGGGGGGASSIGEATNVGGNGGGNGGAGLQWVNSSYYAGGGGGGSDYDGPSGAPPSGSGGIGGGGQGASSAVSSVAGTANTGGGGGGAAGNGGSGKSAASGGSGVVIIRYPTPA